MQTIAQTATALGVTPRTLRHYEQLGLFTPTRDGGNDYRLYSASDLALLRIVVVLRRLGVSLDAIGAMVADPSTDRIRATLQAAAAVAGDRARADRAGHDALIAIMASLAAATGSAPPSEPLPAGLAELSAAIDDTIAAHIPAELAPADRWSTIASDPPNEGDLTMTAPEAPTVPPAPPGGRLTDVRIVHIPRATVAASHVVGPDPEERAVAPLMEYIRDVSLLDIKPDARLYGFNHPNPTHDGAPYGYEMRVTIPDDLDVPAPLHRATMEGGTYAAHAIAMGDFHEWAWFDHWVQTSAEWEPAGDPNDAEHMFGSMEEQLNLPALVATGSTSSQLDLLIPVRPKS